MHRHPRHELRISERAGSAFRDRPSATRHYYFEIEPELRAKLKAIAEQRNMKAETLLNEWRREKAAEIEAVGAAR